MSKDAGSLNATGTLSVDRDCMNVIFFSSRSGHTSCSRDWSSDVCSSDLAPILKRSNGSPPAVQAWLRGDDAESNSHLLVAPFQQSVWIYTVVSALAQTVSSIPFRISRSEERRVGKECRSRWSPYH